MDVGDPPGVPSGRVLAGTAMSTVHFRQWIWPVFTSHGCQLAFSTETIPKAWASGLGPTGKGQVDGAIRSRSISCWSTVIDSVISGHPLVALASAPRSPAAVIDSLEPDRRRWGGLGLAEPGGASPRVNSPSRQRRPWGPCEAHSVTGLRFCPRSGSPSQPDR